MLLCICRSAARLHESTRLHCQHVMLCSSGSRSGSLLQQPAPFSCTLSSHGSQSPAACEQDSDIFPGELNGQGRDISCSGRDDLQSRPDCKKLIPCMVLHRLSFPREEQPPRLQRQSGMRSRFGPLSPLVCEVKFNVRQINPRLHGHFVRRPGTCE